MHALVDGTTLVVSATRKVDEGDYVGALFTIDTHDLIKAPWTDDCTDMGTITGGFYLHHVCDFRESLEGAIMATI